MPALAVDAFTRADNADLGTNWTVQTGNSALKVATNAAANSTTGADCIENYNALTWPNDQYSQVKVTISGGSAASTEGGGIGCRMATGANTLYRCVVGNAGSNNIELKKIVAGTYTSLALRTVTYGAGQVLYLDAQGSTLIIKYNGSQAGASVSDSAIASGRAGLAFSSGSNMSVTMDDWEGGDFAAATKAPPPFARPPRTINRRRVA